MGRVAVLTQEGQFGTVDEADVEKLPLGARVLSKREVAERDADETYDKASTAEKIGSAVGMLGPIPFAVRGVAEHLAGHDERVFAPTLPPTVEAYKEGVSSGFTGGIASAATKQAVEYVAGKEAAKAYAKNASDASEASPIAHGAGVVAGLAGGAVAGGPANAVGGGAERLGAAAARGLGATGETVLGRAGIAAAEYGARGATEGALYNGANQFSENILGDKEAATDKVFAAMGLGALYGGIGGAALGSGGSLARSALGAGSSRVARVLGRGEPAAEKTAAAEVAPKPAGTPLDFINPDAGLAERAPAAEQAFEIGAERREMGLRPNAFASSRSAAPEVAARRPFTFKQGAEVPLFGDLEGITAREPTTFRIDPDAGLRPSQMAKGEETADVFRTLKARPRDVSLGRTGDAVEVGAGPVKLPEASRALVEPSAEVRATRSVLADLSTEGGGKGLAYDQAWKAIGAGNGLQSTRFAGKAAKYLPNGTRDVGEVLMRRGVLDPEASFVTAMKSGTPADMLPKIAAERAAVGEQIGAITAASPATVGADEIAKLVDSVARPYDTKLGQRAVGDSVRRMGLELLENVGAQPGDRIPLQKLLEQRMTLDDLVYKETKALDPGGRVEALRTLRTKLEGAITDALDEAGGGLKGELASQYNGLKRDYLALSIAHDAASDSATRMAKGASLGLRDMLFGAGTGGVTGLAMSVGHKLVRERGNAAAAVLLYRAAEMGAIARTVSYVDAQINRAAKGLLSPTKARPYSEPASTLPVRARAREAVRAITEMQADPERFVQRVTGATESMQTHSPTVATGLMVRSMQLLTLLSSKIPQSDPDPLDPHPAPQMSDAEAHALVETYEYAKRPMKFFEDAERGKFTFEGAEVAQIAMPTAFADMQRRVAEGLATLMSSGTRLPFAQRERIGQVMSFPATPSQRPDHMAFLQANVQPPPLPSPAPPKRPLPSKPQQSALDRLEAK